MSRFSSYGQFDSQMKDEMDSGFFGFNNRFRPDQLKPGVLADSQNGRMDLNGEWQVRKGIDIISGSLLIPGSGLTLPFTLDDTGTSPVLVDIVPRVAASCAYSNPLDTTGQFIVVATSSAAVLVNLDPLITTTTAIAYPAGVTIVNEASLVQAFNKVILFRRGETPLIWDGDIANDFVKAPSGDFQQPEQLGDAPTSSTPPILNTSIINGRVTVTSTAHGLNDRDKIVITESNSDLVVGTQYDVASVTANTFTFFAQIADLASSDNYYSEPVSEGVGYIRMPAPEYGVYHSERLAVPFDYDVESTVDTYTDRGTRDEVIFSNGLNINAYDDLNGKFRPNAGTADFIVGLHSFTKDTLIVFMRNSIHVITGTTSLRAGQTTLITDEVGCVARNSIVQVGDNIMFLSDNGVYGVSFQDLYNLRGNEVPLSESIDKTIRSINKDSWTNSVGVYYDNKYYLAVPVGTGVGVNNKVIIYNFLNKQWESIDSVDSTAGFDFDRLLVAGDGLTRGVYAINTFGGVHKLESRTDAVDVITADPSAVGRSSTYDIPAQITTRQFALGAMDRKKWNSFEITTQSSPERDSDFTISAETENIDYNIPLGTLSERLGGNPLLQNEDVSIRGRIGNNRAYGIQFNINNIVGRPRLRSLKVTGGQAFRSTNTAI
jgi:hypothetical protein